MTWPRYKVGDPDPTINEPNSDCPASNGSGPMPFRCTWDAGHPHPQHVAGAGFPGGSPVVAAVWDAERFD